MRHLIAALLFLTGCQTDETLSKYAGSESEWLLIEMGDQVITTTITLTFPEEGRLAGQAPCNIYSAQIISPLPWFELSPIISTKRACPELALENQYLDLLSKMTIAEVNGNVLVLRSDAETLVHKRQN